MRKNKNNTLLATLKPDVGEVIAIVGAGGKTTLMNRLAEASEGRTVVATSTRIYIPEYPWNRFIGKPILWHKASEVVVAAREVTDEKLIGFSDYCLGSGYDLLLIEADGSRRLPLKGWGIDEPVIQEQTTMTIGVLDITTLGMPINNETVYRLEAFRDLGIKGEVVTLEGLCKVVCHEMGLFKRSRGKRILFINKAEEEEQAEMAEALWEKISNASPYYPIDGVVVGSARIGRAERLL